MPEIIGGHGIGGINDPGLRRLKAHPSPLRRCDELTRSLSKLEERYDDLRVSHAHLCDANTVLVEQLARNQKPQPGIVTAHHEDHQGPWSLTQTFVMCLEGEEDKFAGQVRLLDKASVSSVSSAVEKLNACELQCPEGFCIVFSASSRAYFLLYRRDLESLVHSQFRSGEEEVTASTASTAPPAPANGPVTAPQAPPAAQLADQSGSAAALPYSVNVGRSGSRSELVYEQLCAPAAHAQSSAGSTAKHSARRRQGASHPRSTSAGKRARSPSGGAAPTDGNSGGRREIRRLRAELSAWGDELQRREAEIVRNGTESGEELAVLRTEVAQQAESLRRIVELLRRGLREADLPKSLLHPGQPQDAAAGEAGAQSSSLAPAASLQTQSAVPSTMPPPTGPLQAAAQATVPTMQGASAIPPAPSAALMSPPGSTRSSWPAFALQASARSPSRSSRSPPRSPLPVNPRGSQTASANTLGTSNANPGGASTHRAQQQRKPDPASVQDVHAKVPPGAPPSSPPRVVQPRGMGMDYGDGMQRRTMPARMSLGTGGPPSAAAHSMPMRASLGGTKGLPKQWTTPKVAARTTPGDRWGSPQSQSPPQAMQQAGQSVAHQAGQSVAHQAGQSVAHQAGQSGTHQTGQSMTHQAAPSVTHQAGPSVTHQTGPSVTAAALNATTPGVTSSSAGPSAASSSGVTGSAVTGPSVSGPYPTPYPAPSYNTTPLPVPQMSAAGRMPAAAQAVQSYSTMSRMGFNPGLVQ